MIWGYPYFRKHPYEDISQFGEPEWLNVTEATETTPRFANTMSNMSPKLKYQHLLTPQKNKNSTTLGIQCMVYLPSRMVDVYGKCIGKYTSPMDPMGYVAFTDECGVVVLVVEVKIMSEVASHGVV